MDKRTDTETDKPSAIHKKVPYSDSRIITETRSVAARTGRHGMPPPASNDKGKAFCFPN